jgi:anti-sigma factor RsiW
MKCRDTKRAIKSLICGENADTDAIRDHFSTCPRCAQKYAAILSLSRSAENIPAPPVDEQQWKAFTAQLRRRIRHEHPAPLAWWRSLFLAVGEWKLLRFRKLATVSVIATALVVGGIAFRGAFLPEPTEPRLVTNGVTPIPVTPLTPLALPPEVEDVIYMLGPDGFVSGVFSGYIQPGDFIGGHELREDSILEALDRLLS